jgi:hypothetical protein
MSKRTLKLKKVGISFMYALAGKKHNNTFNVRQQAGWTAKSAASQQRCPLTQR